MTAPMPEQVGWQPGAPPQPIPIGFRFHVANGPTGNMLVLELISPMGQTFAFFTPDGAAELIRQAQAALPQVRSGLIIPNGALPTPPPNGHGPPQ